MTPIPPAPDPTGRPRLLPALAASLVVVLAWLVVVWVGTAVTQAMRPPACLGIGFGCEPDPSVATVLVGAVVGAPALLLAWLASLIGWGVADRVASPTTRRWLVWGPPAVLAVLAGMQVIASTIGELLA